MKSAAPAWRLAAGLLLLSGLLFLLGASVGSTGLHNVFAQQADAQLVQIVRDIRMPRVLGAWLAGALLGLAGAVAQGLFRNPLADPYLLGSASGAALGLALAMLALGATVGSQGLALLAPWWRSVGLSGAAFAGSVLAVLLTLTLARGVQHTMRLLLAGVIVGVTLGAMTSLIMLMAPEVMQMLQAYMLGSTALVDWSVCALLGAVWLFCFVAAWALSPALDGLTLGESTALSLGLPLPAMRVALVLVLALATGAAVAQTGLIGFVGLAAPHLVRSLLTLTHARLLVLASLMGGVLLAAADTLARWLLAPQELPVGVLTAVLGGAYLLWRMHRQDGGERQP